MRVLEGLVQTVKGEQTLPQQALTQIEPVGQESSDEQVWGGCLQEGMVTQAPVGTEGRPNVNLTILISPQHQPPRGIVWLGPRRRTNNTRRESTNLWPLPGKRMRVSLAALSRWEVCIP